MNACYSPLDGLLKLLKRSSSSLSYAVARVLRTREETRVMLQPALRPLSFITEANEDAGRLPLTSNHDVFRLRDSEVTGKPVPYFTDCYFLHQVCSPP